MATFIESGRDFSEKGGIYILERIKGSKIILRQATDLAIEVHGLGAKGFLGSGKETQCLAVIFQKIVADTYLSQEIAASIRAFFEIEGGLIQWDGCLMPVFVIEAAGPLVIHGYPLGIVGALLEGLIELLLFYRFHVDTSNLVDLKAAILS